MDMENFKPDLNQKEERIRKKIQGLIKYCTYDQSYDGGEVIWIWGEKTDLYDLLSDYDISDQSKERIVDNLACPSCGFEHFELMSSVGLESKYEIQLNKYVSKASNKSLKEVASLELHLEQFPLLALQNSLARKIFNEIKNQAFPKTKIKGQFFRARRVQSSAVFTDEEMFVPPKENVTEGRFNHGGQAHLYLAGSKETAIKEVVAVEPSTLVWWQEYEVVKSIPKILDLTFDWSNISTTDSPVLLGMNYNNSLRRSDRNEGNWKPDYKITRFIMDCAKNLGYNGIKYNSSKGFFEYDVVLFEPDKTNILPVGKPQIEIFMNEDEQENFASDLLDF